MLSLFLWTLFKMPLSLFCPQRMISEKKYVYILDRACCQFEPDDPDFIRVSPEPFCVCVYMFLSLMITRDENIFVSQLFVKERPTYSLRCTAIAVGKAAVTIQIFHVPILFFFIELFFVAFFFFFFFALCNMVKTGKYI